MEDAHAILCERSEWVCNEKRLIESAGLAGVQRLFDQTPTPVRSRPMDRSRRRCTRVAFRRDLAVVGSKDDNAL